MNKNIKKLTALAFAGAIGMGIAATPVNAAEPTGDTNVYYTTDATTVDAEGKVVMIVPASISLNKNKRTEDMAVTMQMTDPAAKLPTDFTAEVKVASENVGKLVMDGDPQKTADYSFTPNGGTAITFMPKDNQSNKAVFSDFHTFENPQANSRSMEKQATVAVDEANSDIMENEKPGTTFKDKLTFKVTSVSGTGLDGSTITPDK